MTRINVVPVQELCDQHLLAEWRELPRMGGMARRCSDGRRPDCYTLGEGHMKFFLDKGVYLEHRHTALTRELLARGFKLNNTESFVACRDWGYRDYEPTEEALCINRARIAERMPANPRYRETRHVHHQKALATEALPRLFM